MEELGFVNLDSDAGLFKCFDEASQTFIIAVVYVDDAIFLGPSKAAVEVMKKRFMERWESRDLGELKEFLHMRIGRAGQTIYIDQAQYLQAMLQQCGMVNAKAVPTPLPVGYAPVKSLDKAADPELQKRYQTVIGSLLYLMLGTRPDISFAVTKMAQFAANPTEDHLSHALYICRYLVGTPNYRLRYDGASGQGLNVCTDSDWASDVNTRRSTSGYFIKLAGGLISWTTKAQKTVALSSTKAEYMALSDCSCQVVWMHTLMGELGYSLKPIPICGDNQGLIFITSNPVTVRADLGSHLKYSQCWSGVCAGVLLGAQGTVRRGENRGGL